MSESLRDKLARLRQEQSSARALPPTEEMRSTLARHAARDSRRRPALESAESQRSRSLGDPVGLRSCSASGTFARCTTLNGSGLHGRWRLDQALQADRSRVASLAREPRLETIDWETAVFLDTETTGLAGGAGTYVFLVGLGQFHAGNFEVWQGFLNGPAGEAALLAEAARRIAAASCVVSFFGKSFDRHRLEDKMRLHGIAPPFEAKPHLDLYWPLRRLHRGRFADCRLRTLEAELAGVQRTDDLPGSHAPAAWFDFLAARPHRLEGVFEHNLDDIKSLSALLSVLAAS